VAGAIEDPRGGGDAVMPGANRIWIMATLLFAALWLATLVWGLHRRAASPAAGRRGPGASPAADAPTAGAAQLARVLDTGDLGEVAQVLSAMARPPVRDVDELRGRLDDDAQCDAIDALQRARWGDGDGVQARRLLRSAFARGPRWKPASPRAQSPLPPLYPGG
jgi:hypothetical protein